ncbi:amidohydrolase family protein [candidate division KSB1 bacterium]
MTVPKLIAGLLSFSVIALIASGCGGGDSLSKLKSYPKIDVHTHICEDADFVWEVQDDFKIKYFSICTHGLDEPALKRQIKLARELYKQNPDRFAWATSFDLVHRYESGWLDNVLAGLKQDFGHGAVSVKVWKEIGMEIKDSDGNFTQIDDPMFAPILDLVSKQGKTLVAHIAEPMNAWLPLDQMTVNNDRAYFTQNPQYHAYNDKQMPHHDTILAARDRMLAANPDLRVVGCHLGSLEYDTDVLAECFDKYPNFAVDTAARVCHFQVQDREKVRRFLIKYQDRVLYGTDLIVGSIQEGRTGVNRERMEKTFTRDLEYFATANEMTVPEVDGPFNGLDLPMPVLKKIFRENAVRWYPGIAD